MSKIKEILNDQESVLVFDIDGVLALLEFGDYHHYKYTDEQWNKQEQFYVNNYTKNAVSKKLQSFLKEKDMKRVYVVSSIRSVEEGKYKKEFVRRYYNILDENIYYVENNKNKEEKLRQIKEKYPNLENYKIIMIDDNVSVLNDIMQNTEFSTAHISSFLDIK